MIQIKNFLIKREQSQACLSFAKREKSRLLAKLMITLVALLAVTTGAWAQTQWTSGDCTLTLNNGTLTVSGKGAMADYQNSSTRPWVNNRNDITSVVVESGVTKVGVLAFYNCENMTSVTLPEGLTSIGYDAFYSCTSVTDVNLYADPANLTWNEEGCDDFIETVKGSTKCHVLAEHLSAYQTKFNGVVNVTFVGDLEPLASATAVDIAWNAATKTGTFKQPAGNVTVSVEYYDLATLAFQGLTAAEDAAAKTEAPLAVLADGAVTGGTLMYYVATDENFSQADAIALAETEWSAAIPTAETIEAAGTCYVWYYIKGDDEHSDTDPKPLQVTVLPEPTYTVEFAEGTPESDKWTAEPNTGVTKGETVTVTYTGSKKVLGVKAEKKAKAGIVNPAVGQIIGSDGNNYGANATLPTGVTAVAKIAYVGSETGVEGYTNGLALALNDKGEMIWPDATGASGAAAHTPAAPTTTSSWMLPSQDQWNKMINAAGGYTALRDGFSGITGASNLMPGTYWSSTEVDSSRVWRYYFGSGAGYWSRVSKDSDGLVRACLAF